MNNTRSQKSSKSKCCTSFDMYKALFYAFLAGLSFSMNSVLVRFAKDISAVQMSMYRFIGMLFFGLPLLAHKGGNVIGPKGSRMMLLYRSFAAVLTVICCFFAFRNLPIGEASVIVYSTPVFVTIFARIILKEVCGVVQSVTVVLTVLGIILIINPSVFLNQADIHGNDHMFGVIAGFAALLSQCAMVILTRQTRNIHYSVVSAHASTIGTLLCVAIVGSVFGFVLPRCGVRRWVAIAMGASSSMGQIFYIKALQLENVGPVATLKAASDITIAVIWQITIFKETLDAFAVGGTVLVVMSVILIGGNKWVMSLPKDSPVKKKLKLLTY